MKLAHENRIVTAGSGIGVQGSKDPRCMTQVERFWAAVHRYQWEVETGQRYRGIGGMGRHRDRVKLSQA